LKTSFCANKREKEGKSHFEEKQVKVAAKIPIFTSATHLGTGAMHLPGAIHQAQDLQRELNGPYPQKVHYAPRHWRDASVR